MMFGAVPLSYKGMTTKIHFIKSPKPQILMTKLFSINPKDLDSSGRRNSVSSSNSDLSASSTHGCVGPVDIRGGTARPYARPGSMHQEDFSESSDEDIYRFQ